MLYFIKYKFINLKIKLKLYFIINKYHNDVWKLYKIIKHNNVINKKLYIQAFEKILSRYGCWIGCGATFLSTPCLPHGFYGIFISNGARIGYNSVIFQHVTIGSNTIKNSKGFGAPYIGDNCYIGSGAKIIGNVKIGNNVRIGSNCVIFEDIPDNSTVVMQKPRIIVKQNTDNKFYMR